MSKYFRVIIINYVLGFIVKVLLIFEEELVERTEQKASIALSK